MAPMKFFHLNGKDLATLHIQYHGFFWAGDTKKQVASSHGVGCTRGFIYEVNLADSMVYYNYKANLLYMAWKPCSGNRLQL